ncbi:hypothetical protein MNV49_000637 [Pseudohyphozyma bogoriensis]|nr:hypothetical protein MNV49_000637 [Pseudohyphozyma bogoriensis]
MVTQTFTPRSLAAAPSQAALQKEFVGKKIEQVRSPAYVIDRTLFAANCARMHERSALAGVKFRGHLKTHKTAEGTKLQMVSEKGTSDAAVVSTFPELWGVIDSGLVDEGVVKDILYGVPVPLDRIEELASISKLLASKGAALRVLIDNTVHVEALNSFGDDVWSVFIKVDGGGTRAGLPPNSEGMDALLKAALASTKINVFGFYCHNGKSYKSTTAKEAGSFLTGEIAAVNDVAASALKILGGKEPSTPWVLAMGSTPAAHAVGEAAFPAKLHGVLELHAGNYGVLDGQQAYTGQIKSTDIAGLVYTRILSSYPHRNEVLCDAAAIAMSLDGAPKGTFGDVIKPESCVGWQLVRMSQEHGTLARASGEGPNLEIGQGIYLAPQHACLTAAQYPWYYIVENGGDTIVDVWVPWKGW